MIKKENNAPMNAQNIRVSVQRLNDLPPVTPQTQQIIDAVFDENVSVSEFAALIQLDPIILARTLSLANSAYYARQNQVSNIEEAIMVLGLRLCKHLVLSISLSKPYSRTACPGFSHKSFWSVAALTAHAARQMAPLVKMRPQPDEHQGYVTGMLHSIGLLPLVFLYPEQMAQVFSNARPAHSISPVERMTLGTDHYVVGAWLTSKWHLPEYLVEAIAHCPDKSYRGEHWPLVVMVRSCARWANHYYYTREADSLPAAIESSLVTIGVSPEKAQLIFADIDKNYQEIETIASVLSEDS